MSNPNNNHKPKIILPPGMQAGDTPLQNMASGAALTATMRLQQQARLQQLIRMSFEDVLFRYYERLKAAGWAAPGEGDPTPEALFWRNDQGMYGVASVQAAWMGFRMGIGFSMMNLDSLPAVLDGAGFTAAMLMEGTL